MSRLRKKLAAAGSNVSIVNVRGVGYRLEARDG
jgi:DNA-binding response OmpR family regulator